LAGSGIGKGAARIFHGLFNAVGIIDNGGVDGPGKDPASDGGFIELGGFQEEPIMLIYFLRGKVLWEIGHCTGDHIRPQGGEMFRVFHEIEAFFDDLGEGCSWEERYKLFKVGC